ncbi:MAG: 6-phosphogluconolactonase [Candidatus Sumerlaeaceae bacterium]
MLKLPAGVVVLPDPAAVTRRAAQEMVHVAQQCVAQLGTFIVALSGGSTPKAMYELLTKDEELHVGMPWWQTHWFWSDERHVALDSPDSNYRMANEAMLSKSPTPAANIHRVAVELQDPVETARLYEAEIRGTFSQLGRSVEPVPSFDLLLLGMGVDGHTASLFPGSPALEDSTHVFSANPVEKLGAFRFTVTPATVQSAERVMLLVCGADKADTLHQVLRGPFNPRQLPTQLATRRTGSTIWLLDAAAAVHLLEVEPA